MYDRIVSGSEDNEGRDSPGTFRIGGIGEKIAEMSQRGHDVALGALQNDKSMAHTYMSSAGFVRT